LDASAYNQSVETSWVVVFPAFQRTYVTSNTAGTYSGMPQATQS
jgi:hypothetical protein